MWDLASQCWERPLLVGTETFLSTMTPRSTALEITPLSLPFCSVDVVPAPKNLRFSDVTQTSFRATWEHGAPDVALFRIGWSKKGENEFQYVSKIPFGQVFLDGSHRDSFGPSEWEHGKCRRLNRLLCLCFPHQDILNNDETSYVLENLEIDTPYDVSVTAIYPDESESEDLLGTERTRKRCNASWEMFPSQSPELKPFVFLKLPASLLEINLRPPLKICWMRYLVQPLYLSIFASLVSKSDVTSRKYVCGKTSGCFFFRAMKA